MVEPLPSVNEKDAISKLGITKLVKFWRWNKSSVVVNEPVILYCEQGLT
jgi:hypothetical protein